MFHSRAKSMRKPVLWLMLPLAIFAGRPNAACICGDGSVMTVCCQTNWLFADAGASQANSENCCGLASSSTCPRCCQPAHREPVDGCSAADGCSCHPVANNVEPTKITDWSADDPESQLRVPAEALSALRPAISCHSLNISVEALPPPDMVVLFLHLTI